MRTYRFYSDPGHGWLAVKRAELVRLGIMDKITPYSYQKGETVYLEEDCDAETFMEAKQARGESVTIKESNSPVRDSPVRGYQSFRKDTP